MSTDDFETRLRERLAELADREDDWDDPAPVAREIAAAGIAPDDDPAILAPVVHEPRRRWLPGLAVAAVVLALVVGGGLGIRELVHSASNAQSSSGAGFAADAQAGSSAGVSPCAAPLPTPCAAAPNAVSGEPTTSREGGNIGPGDTAGCEVRGDATSTGPLATIAAIRPSGITGSQATSGGTVAIPYQLTFAEAGGTAEVRAASATWTAEGRLCGSSGTASPGAVQQLPVTPGAGVNGSATFAAVDSRGAPLPGGEYQVVIVIPYSVGGSGMSQLVSAPVTVTVTP